VARRGIADPPGSVIIANADDNPADTIVPRLMAEGADLARIDIIRASDVVESPDGIYPRSLRDIDFWAEVLGRRPGCRLLIIDPLISYLRRSGRDGRSARGAIAAFRTEIVEEFNVCAVCSMITTKSSYAMSSMNMARVVYRLARDGGDDGRILVTSAKWGHDGGSPPPLAFRIVSARVSGPDGLSLPSPRAEFEARTGDVGRAS
jgi:hypothetical protein